MSTRSRDIVATALVAAALFGTAQAEPGTLSGANRQQKIAKGQSLATFARSWGLAAEQVGWANGLPMDGRLEKGSKATLPARILPPNPPADGAVVNLAERGMYVFKGGRYKGFFPLAIGRGDNAGYRTPTGSYKITSRVKNPDWVAPDSTWAKAAKKETIKGNDAKNPLGEYWFGISHPDPGYGIHANVEPDTTGDKVSHGCMRLYPEHAAKIFKQGWLTEGDTVRIEHRSALLGKDSKGQLYLALFPAAYGKVDAKTRLAALLKKEGLADLFPEPSLQALASSQSGIPRPLFGQRVGLTIDGKPAAGKTLTARRAGSLLVSASLARELGGEVAYHADTGQIMVSKDGKSKAYSLKTVAGTPRAFRYGNQVMVPARTMLGALGVPFSWDAKKNQLEIDG